MPPQLHFDWSLSFGTIVELITILGATLKIVSKLSAMEVKVETMWLDYIQRNGENKRHG